MPWRFELSDSAGSKARHTAAQIFPYRASRFRNQGVPTSPVGPSRRTANLGSVADRVLRVFSGTADLDPIAPCYPSRELYFAQHPDELIILDEIHRAPDIFQTLRGVIDGARRKGKRTGLFLLLGSVAIDLLRQSGETLAGRMEYVDMAPLDALEINAGAAAQERLWLRGGFPDSYLAASDEDSFRLRQS